LLPEEHIGTTMFKEMAAGWIYMYGGGRVAELEVL
jgi:hypothetical protein